MENTQTLTSTQEPVEKNVEEKVVEQLSLEEINQAAGREFKGKDDFLKHYNNLKSFVGAKAEPDKAVEETKKVLEERDKELTELKSWLADAGIDRETVNPFELSRVAKAIANKVDIAPKSNPGGDGRMEKIKDLGSRVFQRGQEADKVALVEEVLGLKNPFQGDKNALGRLNG